MTTTPKAPRSRAGRASLLALALAALASLAVAADDATRYATALGELINEHRARHGLPALVPAPSLAALAAAHAAPMAKEKRLSHDGFAERFQRARAPHCVENVGAGFRTPHAELDAWERSAVHAKNLLDPRISHMGIGVAGGYVTFFACG
jgi:uncharacterized protein YkwD